MQMYMWTKYSCDVAARLFGMGRDRVDRRWARRHEQGADQVYHMVTQARVWGRPAARAPFCLLTGDGAPRSPGRW